MKAILGKISVLKTWISSKLTSITTTHSFNYQRRIMIYSSRLSLQTRSSFVNTTSWIIHFWLSSKNQRVSISNRMITKWAIWVPITTLSVLSTFQQTFPGCSVPKWTVKMQKIYFRNLHNSYIILESLITCKSGTSPRYAKTGSRESEVFSKTRRIWMITFLQLIPNCIRTDSKSFWCRTSSNWL